VVDSGEVDSGDADRGDVDGGEMDRESAAHGPRADRPVRRRRARLVVVAGVTTLVLAALAIGLTARWFVWPAAVADHPRVADAVVMFGGAGPRYQKAVGLADAATAPWLVLSDPRDDSRVWTAYGQFCQDQHAYHAVCFDPEPKTTRGEARYVAELARRQGWSSVVLVTTTEQAARAKRLVERCWDGDVQVVGVSSGRKRPLRIAYEWAATLRAELFRRGC
jgi:uncharacterized SAM-binding protein YcdF (DUF218 family)